MSPEEGEQRHSVRPHRGPWSYRASRTDELDVRSMTARGAADVDELLAGIVNPSGTCWGTGIEFLFVERRVTPLARPKSCVDDVPGREDAKRRCWPIPRRPGILDGLSERVCRSIYSGTRRARGSQPQSTTCRRNEATRARFAGPGSSRAIGTYPLGLGENPGVP